MTATGSPTEFNEAEPGRGESRTRLRRWLTAVLVVLTSCAVVIATLATWAHETVFDTDTFMDTVEPALDDPAVYTVVSERVSSQTLEALDLDERVADRLSGIDEYPKLASLAPAIAGGLESRITAMVDRLVMSDAFRTSIQRLVRSAHRGAVALTRAELPESGVAYVENGEVRLNLIPVIVGTLRSVLAEFRDVLPDVNVPERLADMNPSNVADARRQLSESLGARLPEDFGQVTVMTEESLSEVQATVRSLDRLRWGLVVLAVALAALTLVVSPARRRTLVHLALGVIIGLILGFAATRWLQSAIAAEFADPDGSAAARAIVTEVVSSLRTTAVVVGAVAVAIALVAHLSRRDGTWPGPLRSRIDAWLPSQQ